jgi:hypothetical protein
MFGCKISFYCTYIATAAAFLGPWPSIWEGKGPKGHEVLEDTEDTLLPQFTSENPLAGGDPSGEPAFNAQVASLIDLFL